MILESEVRVAAVLYKIGKTPSTASGTPMYVMMSVAVYPLSAVDIARRPVEVNPS